MGLVSTLCSSLLVLLKPVWTAKSKRWIVLNVIYHRHNPVYITYNLTHKSLCMYISARTLLTILFTVFITKQVYAKYQSKTKTLRLQSSRILVALYNNDCITSQTTVIFVFTAVNNIRIWKTVITHPGRYEQPVQHSYKGFTKWLLTVNCSGFTQLTVWYETAHHTVTSTLPPAVTQITLTPST